MADKTIEIRSALLSSQTTRNNLHPGKDSIPAIARALAAIDQIGGLYDGLRKVHETENPNETPTARAMRFETQLKAADAKARKITEEAGAMLDSFAQSLKVRALEEAGLASQPLSGPEIRASLRGMTQAERDKAIAEAFDRGDVEVLSSIYGQNRLLWGGTSKPLERQFALYIDKAAPEVRAESEALDKAYEGISLAVDSFVAAGEKWRDPLTAAKGFAQEKEYAQAEAALKAAMGETS